jgi:hypothetical protein
MCPFMNAYYCMKRLLGNELVCFEEGEYIQPEVEKVLAQKCTAA